MTETQYFLLPGPTQVPPSVLRAGSAPMVNHRGPEFKVIFQNMIESLKQIFRTKNEIITLTCSGTGGMEASIVNFINPGDKVIVASIGNFGRRYRDLAQTFGAEVDFIEAPWGSAIDPEEIKKRLDADSRKEIKAIIFQHNETSTGVYNPLEAIAAACDGHPALRIVDSVSGMASAPLATDEWGLDVVVAASQKAFMSPPGLAFIAVSEQAWQVQAKNTNRKFYFDLDNARKFALLGQTPFTPAIATAYAVAQALKIMLEKGLDNIIADHFRRRDIVRQGIEALGLRCVADPGCASPAVTAIYTPKGIAPPQIVKPLREKYNAVVAGGMGDIKDESFRIGHLGYINDLDLIAVLAALEMVLLELGLDITLGSGVAAAQKHLMKSSK
ncbi:MAG: alanine--glyoxylate aminotransferase family protein [Clostridiales bacterium]|nr:alanine--glyoxylate aminotransferase family protein [Clostridiales bacterium]